MNLVPLMSPPKKLEAVLLWNDAATQFQHIVNSADETSVQEPQQNHESSCNRELRSAVGTESSTTLNMIEANNNCSNDQTMPSELLRTEFDSVLNDIASNQPVDRQLGIANILEDPLFNSASNVIGETSQTQQNVITEDNLSQSAPRSPQLNVNAEYNNLLTNLSGDIESSNSLMATGSAYLSTRSAPISNIQTNEPPTSLLALLQQPNFCPSPITNNQIECNSLPINGSNVITENEDQDSLVLPYLNCNSSNVDAMQYSGACDITCNLNGGLDRGFDIVSDQDQLGISSSVNNCSDEVGDEMRRLHQLQTRVTNSLNENVPSSSEACQPDRRFVNLQVQLSLSTTNLGPRDSTSLILNDDFRCEPMPVSLTVHDSESGPQSCGDSNACDVCGKSGFSSKGNLKRHQRAHSGEKPFVCEVCDQRFTEKKSLKIHMRKHSNERPFQCEICQKLFTQAIVLKAHMATHNQERKFPCSRCDKSFRQNSQLKLHQMRHEGIKRLECASCPRKFLTKGDLERHAKTHTGEKPFSCHLCDGTFTRQQSLNEHLNRHSGKKPYSCTHCGMQFAEMSACYKVSVIDSHFRND